MKKKPTIRKVNKDGKFKSKDRPGEHIPIGKIVEKLQKDAIAPTSVDQFRDQSESMTEDYMDNLRLAVTNGKKVFPKNFFVAVLTKHERALKDVFRNYFHPRMTCPTPNYDQALYKYNHKRETIEFIWVIPDQRTCNMLYMNKDKVYGKDLQLLPYVINFIEGKFHAKEKRYNKKIEANL